MDKRVSLKFKYYKNIIREYNIYKNEISEIFKNFQYNKGKSRKKIKKHFPTIEFKSVNIFIFKHINEKHCSFSLLIGDIEIQKQKIINTMYRRFNCVDIFDKIKLKRCIEEEYMAEYRDKKLFSIDTNKYGIVKYKKEEIGKKFPAFIRTDGEIMFNCVYDIWTENSNHYCDLINIKLCDRILICCDYINKKYNLMFETSKDIDDLNIPRNIIIDHILKNYNKI